MTVFNVNGKQVQGEARKKLLDFLRDDLRLTSVKNGCGSGACGACTVLADGKPIRSCVTPLGKVEGKNIITVEGLSDHEREVYAFAFAEAGAVQCGFCIPGMVLGAKALLDVDDNPDEEVIRKAIHPNLCRCTGYKKIVDAIKIAAGLFRESALGSPNAQGSTSISNLRFSGRMGEHMHRVDSAAKTLGTGKYVDDLSLPGMFHASALRSVYPRARVVKIDKSAALSHPDCVAVLTASDVPGEIKIGHLTHISDYDVMIAEGGITRFIGDALALVVCIHRESLAKVKALVNVEYEVLEPLTSPTEAMADNAPLLHANKRNILSHEHLVRGNADEALAKSKFTVSRHYSLPFTEHAFMEPECAIATPDGADGLTLYSAGQSIYD